MQENADFQAKYMQCRKLQKIQTEETKRYIGGFWRGEGGGRGRKVYKGTQGLGVYARFYHADWGDVSQAAVPPKFVYYSPKPSASQCDLILETKSLRRLLVEMK